MDDIFISSKSCTYHKKLLLTDKSNQQIASGEERKQEKRAEREMDCSGGRSREEGKIKIDFLEPPDGKIFVIYVNPFVL